MIIYVENSLFESPAQVWTNTVNTVGAMGKGIAAEFRQLYPDMYKKYKALCEQGLFQIGQLWLYKTPYKWILNFPTKENWRKPSKLEYIESGLKKFQATYAEKGIQSISFPMLGCGNGELDWENQVRPMMEHYLRELPIQIYIHLYQQAITPEHRNIKAIEAWLRGEPQNLPFEDVWKDVENLLKRKSTFETLDQSRHFDAYLSEDKLNIHDNLADPTEISIAKGDRENEEGGLIDFWQYVQRVNYVIDKYVPYGLSRYAPYLFSIFADLAYVEPLHFYTRQEIQRQQGIRLTPFLDPMLPKLG